MPENFPPPGTSAWDERFYHFWIPYWKLDFPLGASTFTSALVLWLPGIILNRFLYSATILWVPLTSLGARLALLALLILLLNWLERNSRRPALHYLILGLPLVLLFMTSDVAGFYNSFYQESASLVFIPLVLAIIVWGQHRARSTGFYVVYLVAITLLTLSKTASFYWAVLALPGVISFQQIRTRPFRFLPLAAGLLVLPLVAGLTLTHVQNEGPNRAYNTLYGGVLLLSDAPQQRLAELGLADTVTCLGKDWYSGGGADCSKPYWDQIDFTAAARVMLVEPQIVLKQIQLLADLFQNLSLNLGKYAAGADFPHRETRLNLWSKIKQTYFPRGMWLLAVSLLLAFAAAWAWKKDGLPADLARLGLICLLAMWIDSFIEIWGDGQRDLLNTFSFPTYSSTLPGWPYSMPAWLS